MGTSALGGFVEGLQGGITHRQQALRNKKIDRMLDQEATVKGMAIQGQQDDINAIRHEKGLGPRDFSQFDADQDPYGMKLTDFFRPKKLWQNFKNNVGMGSQTQSEPSFSPARANEQAIEDATYGAEASSMGNRNMPQYGMAAAADGGAIRRMADGGVLADDYIRASERIAGGGDPKKIPTRLGRYGRAAGRVAGKAGMVGGAIAGGVGAYKGAKTGTDEYRDRYTMPEALMYDDDDSNLTMFAKDVGARAIGVGNDVGRTAAGMLGFGRDSAEGQAIRESDVAAPPEQPPTAAQAVTPRAAAAPPQAPQQQAIPETNGPFQIGPDAPIAMPDEMPTMNTEDWVAYRAASVENMVMRGATIPEAHEAVTMMQQKGFLNYGQQALQLLAAGDPLRAGMALKAAYQYFPNGADVKFGVTKDKAGQPALIAMGKDEKTGEPMPNGTMIINGERLAVMMEQMTDPSAFRTWTKDWREFEQDLRKYNEIEKPAAEATAINQDRTGRAALNNSEANLLAAERTGAGGGMTQSQWNSALKMVQDGMADRGMMQGIEPADQGYLTQVAAIIFMEDPSNWVATVEEIMRLYREGGTEAVDTALRRGE